MRPMTTTTSVRIKSAFERYGLAVGDVVEAEVTRSPYIPAYRGCSEAVMQVRERMFVSLGVEGFDWEVVA